MRDTVASAGSNKPSPDNSRCCRVGRMGQDWGLRVTYNSPVQQFSKATTGDWLENAITCARQTSESAALAWTNSLFYNPLENLRHSPVCNPLLLSGRWTPDRSRVCASGALVAKNCKMKSVECGNRKRMGIPPKGAQ